MLQHKASSVAAASSRAERSVPVMARLAPSHVSLRAPVVKGVASRLSTKFTSKQVIREIEGVARSAVIPRATTEVAADTKTTKPLNIVFVSTEVAPWSKTGGLGDVVGGLPIELAKRGHHVVTIAPRYDQYYDGWDTSVVVNIDGEQVRFFHSFGKGVHRVFVDHPSFLAKVWGKTGSKLYGPKSGADFIDNHKRFTLFNKACVEAVKVLPFCKSEKVTFVANDWHSALVPVLIKDVYQPKGEFADAKVAFCIHNIAFQGRMWEDCIKDMNLPPASLERFKFEDGYNKVYTEVTPLDDDDKPQEAKTTQRFKKLNWMKAGILASDKVVTVSPNYAAEIAEDEAKGVELDGAIRSKGGAIGIVNGMDIEEWNPKKDKYLTVKYDNTNVLAGKAAAKEALQAELGLPVDPSVPLFAFIGRLEEQKGVDILMAALPKILKTANVQIAILGTGKAKFEKQVNAISKEFKGKAKGVVKFSAPLAHMLTAGADYMLVPSRFEPCGLIQLHAMHYGTPPLVSSTGGLVDTVKEGVTGFHMGAMDPDDLLEEDAEAIAATVIRAADAFSTPLWKEMVKNSISQDLSWARPALKWEGVLEELQYGTASGTALPKQEAVKIPVAEKIPGDIPGVTKPVSKEKAVPVFAPIGAKPPSPAAEAKAPAAGAGAAAGAPKVAAAAAAPAAAAAEPAEKPAAGPGKVPGATVTAATGAAAEPAAPKTPAVAAAAGAKAPVAAGSA